MLTSKQVNYFIDKGKIIYSFDIDNTLINFFSGIPNINLIRHVRKCFENGNYIYIETGRMENEKQRTISELKKFRIPYNELIMNRPKVHLRVDDLCLNVKEYTKYPEYFDRIFKYLGNKINNYWRVMNDKS